jgi:prefoldin beta subunit
MAEKEEEKMQEKEVAQEAAAPGNPFGNLDADTQSKIQELQMMEQSFQQLAMQKNAFNMEASETEHVINEVEKSEGEIMRIVSGQVAIKSTKEKVLEEMNKKKELIDIRMKDMEKQEGEFNKRVESLREEIMGKING